MPAGNGHRSRCNLLTLYSTQDFLNREWEDPPDALDRSIKHAADAQFVAFDSVAEDWLREGKTAMDTAVLIDTEIVSSDDAEQAAHGKANLKALELLMNKYPHLFQITDPAAASQEPILLEEQKDVGFKMVEHGGHDAVQTIQLDTMMFINGELFGAPSEDMRKNICSPPKEEVNTIFFQVSYLYPEHDYTYIVITVARWSGNWNQGTSLKILGTIEVPMSACQENEPELEVLTDAEVGEVLGVEACSCRAARYTVTGTPRFYYAEYAAGLPQGDIPEGLSKIASLIDGKSSVSISLLHPIRRKMEDATQDFTYKVLENCNQGWLRDGGKPWDIYYANSRSKRMLDLGTVPKGEAIPHLDQLPARNTFDHREQYTIRLAVGNQQEKEFHDRHYTKLRDCDVPIRLIADRRSLHPTTKTPQIYFAIVDTSAAGPNVDFLLPRDGDSANFIMLGVFAKNQGAAAADMGEIDNEHISAHIRDSVHDVRKDSSLDSESALYEKLQDKLNILCVRDDSGNDIAANLETLKDKLKEIRQLAKDEKKLLEFIRSSRTWLAPPPPEIDEDANPFTDPIRLCGYRVNVPSKLWSPYTHLWRLTVPIDKRTGPLKLPLILDVRDASVDDAGKLLTPRAFTALGKSGEANLKVKMEVIDSDKTHKAEMTALKKLSAPHTMPEDDRPSIASLDLFTDVVRGELRDVEPLKELMTDLEQLRRGKHDNKDLQRFYKRLSRDKHNAIEYFLDNKKRIKYIHGPPGTGKSHLALFLTCIAVMFSPPPTNAYWDRPVDLGRRLQPEEFDEEVDKFPVFRPVQLTDAPSAATPETPRTKVLIVCGQNNPVDDLFRKFEPMWDSLGGRKGGKYQPKAVRLYSWKSESKDFARRFAKVGRHIQRTFDDDSTGGILMKLLNGFSDQVDEFDREHRRTRNSSYSILDMAVELFEEGRENGKYEVLSYLIDQLAAQPDTIYLNGKEISRQVQEGPQKDALAQADVVFATPVAVADKTFRETFRPHYIMSDENPRDKEITTLILLAHYTPKAYFFFGDHNQLGPIVFSTYQHRKYKPPRAFKPADDEQASGVENLSGNDPGHTEHDPATSTPGQTGDGMAEYKETKTEKTSTTKDEPVQQEEMLPKPATFALQLARPMISRLVGTGLPCSMLTQNFRQHGTVGDFFSAQFYNNKVEFVVEDERFSSVDKAAIKWLTNVSGKDKITGNTLMINMNSRENSQARSFSNIGHVNFVLANIADLLGDHAFRPSKKKPNDGKVMIIVPYKAQRNLYNHELQKRAVRERDSKGLKWVDFNKDQVEIRTHQGAQGHEASVVIVDLTRSDAPGHTGHQELVNVCSSRAICAQLVLVNTSMFKFVESQNSPYVRSLVSWVHSHTEKGMLIDLDHQTAKEWRITCCKCYGFGHNVNECMYNTTKARLICGIPGCGGQHHSRDCFKDKNLRDSDGSADKSQAPDESTDKAEAPGTTSQADASSTTRPTRSEQSKRNLQASRAMKKAARKLEKGQEQEEETQNGEGEATGGNDTKPNDWSTSGGNTGGWSDSAPS